MFIPLEANSDSALMKRIVRIREQMGLYAADTSSLTASGDESSVIVSLLEPSITNISEKINVYKAGKHDKIIWDNWGGKAAPIPLEQ